MAEGEQFHLTKLGYERLQEELRSLEEARDAQRVVLDDVDEDTGNLEAEEAGAMFDAQTELERLNERIGHIQFVLERAVVRAEDPNPRKVDPGERITVWDFAEKRERRFDLVSSPEAHITYADDDGRHVVSIESPVGQALLGKQVGDVAEITIPDGVTRLAVRRIEPIPGEAG